jgi:MYXO-CTERM domain-containing protein
VHGQFTGTEPERSRLGGFVLAALGLLVARRRSLLQDLGERAVRRTAVEHPAQRGGVDRRLRDQGGFGVAHADVLDRLVVAAGRAEVEGADAHELGAGLGGVPQGLFAGCRCGGRGQRHEQGPDHAERGGLEPGPGGAGNALVGLGGCHKINPCWHGGHHEKVLPQGSPQRAASTGWPNESQCQGLR